MLSNVYGEPHRLYIKPKHERHHNQKVFYTLHIIDNNSELHYRKL